MPSNRRRRAAAPSASDGGAVPPRQASRPGFEEPDPASLKKRRGKRSKASVVSTVLIVVGVLLLLVAAGLFIYTQVGYQQARSAYDELDQYAQVSDSAADDPLAGLPKIDFASLEAINPDVQGWVYCPNNNLNYPVVQAEDNSTYLHTLFDGTRNDNGTIFMDMDDTAPGCVDPQTTLYGHHMLSGMMFNFVDKAEHDQAEFDAVGPVYYFTRDATYVFEPLFCTRVAPDELQVRAPSPEGGLAAYLQGLYQEATSHAADASQRISAAEKVLTLVTCNYDLSEKQRSIMVLGLTDTLPASVLTEGE